MERPKEAAAHTRQSRGKETALLKDAQIKLIKEEYASDMGQRSNVAAVKGAQIEPSKEECVLSMVQKWHCNAAGKDAQIKPYKEECVSGMGQRGQRRNDAAVEDAQMKRRKEECVSDTEQRLSIKYAVVKGVQIKLSMEDCALGMEQK